MKLTLAKEHTLTSSYTRDARFEPYWMLIGRIATAWAGLENGFDQLIWELADIELVFGACFTAQMIGPGPRVKTMMSLVKERGGEADLVKKTSDFGTSFIKAGAKRNRYMHEDILIDEEGGVKRVEITAQSGLRFDIYEFDLKKAETFIEEIVKTGIDLGLLRQEMIRKLPNWSTARHWSSNKGVLRHWKDHSDPTIS